MRIICDLEDLDTPCIVHFYRASKKSFVVNSQTVMHVPDLHDLGIDGFTLDRFVDDRLHTIELGAAQKWCALALLNILRANLFGLTNPRLLDRLHVGVNIVKQRLKPFIREFRIANPGSNITKVKKFSLEALGNLDKPCLKLRAAESKLMSRFTLDLLQKHRSALNDTGTLLLQAGESVCEVWSIMESEPRRMPVSAQQRLFYCCLNHILKYSREAGGKHIPKHHGLIHMAANTHFSGNPTCHSTYEDESENGTIAGIGFHVHPDTFGISVFEHLYVLDNLDDL